MLWIPGIARICEAKTLLGLDLLKAMVLPVKNRSFQEQITGFCRHLFGIRNTV